MSDTLQRMIVTHPGACIVGITTLIVAILGMVWLGSHLLVKYQRRRERRFLSLRARVVAAQAALDISAARLHELARQTGLRSHASDTDRIIMEGVQRLSERVRTVSEKKPEPEQVPPRTLFERLLDDDI